MPDSPDAPMLAILPILEQLQARLDSVHARLGEVPMLEVERDRLVQAIEGLRALNEPIDKRSATLRSFTTRLANIAAQSQQKSAPQPVSPSAAAIAVLRAAKQPMHIRRIIGKMQSNGWYVNREYESLRGSIASTLNERSKAHDVVVKLGAGIYGLIEWKLTEQAALIPRDG